MLTVADENMPHAVDFFSRFGDVRLVPGRALSHDMLRDADLLMVRSVTKVNRALLEHSRVRFVGTATIGTDHIDLEFLNSRGIAFSAAPGCNAESVAQYIAAALAWSAGRKGWRLGEKSIGIVGVGNCGARVERVARDAFGMRVILNDPPLARATGDPKYRPLDELMDCDYLVLHVPLTRGGEDATYRLFDASRMARLAPHAIVINACRGGVIDEAPLRAALDARKLGGAILDAWEGEPAIDPQTLDRAMLATPHVAGYSHDGKVNGTRMVYEAACRALNLPIEAVTIEMPPPAVGRITLDAAGRRLDSVLNEIILRAYPIDRDDADLRASIAEKLQSGEPHAPAFDALRKHYPLRREFQATAVDIQNPPASWPPDWPSRIGSLGFSPA